MSLTAEEGLSLPELLAQQRALVSQLRDAEHWRRLTAARLDLAIAAVTDIDELSVRPLPCTPAAPHDLRHLVGIPPSEAALPEAAAVFRLRKVLAELEGYTESLRDSCSRVSREVLDRLAAEGYLPTRPQEPLPPDDGPDVLRRVVTARPHSERRIGRIQQHDHPPSCRPSQTAG